MEEKELAGLCQKDEEHQKEWNDWYATHFDDNGNYIEDEAVVTLRKIKVRKEQQQSKHEDVITHTKNIEDVSAKSFGNS